MKRVWTFDSIYGIFIGISDSGDYTKDRQGEGWTETSTDTAQIDDTNLAFSVQTTQTTSQSEYTTSTPSLYTEIWTVASTTTETVATSQDVWLNQLGEKFPGGLIGLVGIIAIVVVLLAVTVARRNRKSAPPTPTRRDSRIYSARGHLSAIVNRSKCSSSGTGCDAWCSRGLS